MKKTIHINLAGRPFVIDEDAYQALDAYIMRLKHHFAKEEGADEIIEDIEDGLAHILHTQLGKRKIITLGDVEASIEHMGMPGDFDVPKEEKQPFADRGQGQAKEDLFGDNHGSRRLYRDVDDRVIAGVCAGIARYFDVPSWVVRIVFFIGLVPGVGSPVVFYILLWFLIPPASTQAEKMRMRGREITLKNIVNRAEKEIRDLADRLTEWTENKIK